MITCHHHTFYLSYYFCYYTVSGLIFKVVALGAEGSGFDSLQRPIDLYGAISGSQTVLHCKGLRVTASQ